MCILRPDVFVLSSSRFDFPQMELYNLTLICEFWPWNVIKRNNNEHMLQPICQQSTRMQNYPGMANDLHWVLIGIRTPFIRQWWKEKLLKRNPMTTQIWGHPLQTGCYPRRSYFCEGRVFNPSFTSSLLEWEREVPCLWYSSQLGALVFARLHQQWQERLHDTYLGL